MLGFIRNYGVQLPQEMSGNYEVVIIKKYMSIVQLYGGILAGIFYAIIEIVFDKQFFRRWAYWKIIGLKSLVYFIMFFIISFSTIHLFEKLAGIDMTASNLRDSVLRPTYKVFFVYFFISIILLNVFKQINQKLGPGMFWKLFLGKYSTPQEEEHIFMFLDLKSSTSYAEQIGHIKYSEMIQRCFYDLNELLERYKANIYQYVGDEAVLTWNMRDGFLYNNCIMIYYAFVKKINENRESYLSDFGFVPEFKAGIHFGKVTVTEVGVIKKEIAYHGDVLNTGARIQGKCNDLNTSLLISEELHSKLSGAKNLKFISYPNIQLRGKKEFCTVYSSSLN
jgi:adenylate cyclase